MQTKIIERYFFFTLLFATFVFSFLIFRPFWIVLIFSISFSIILFPLYQWFNKIKFPNWLSAFLTVLIFMIVIGALVLSAGVVVLNQSQNLYYSIINNKSTLSFINNMNTSINQIMPMGMSFNLYDRISNFISYIVNNLAGIFTFTLSTLFYFILTFLSIFYFLKDHQYWKKSIKVMSPLSDVDDEKIIQKLSMAVNGIIKGNLLAAFIQGISAWIGFVIFGVENAALWGLVAIITSLIPTIGCGLISIPIVIFLFATGQTIGALGLLLWSIVIVGGIGTFLNPIIVGNKINLHPVLILFSVLGGISLFGPAGILVGPLTISLLYTLISIYRNEFQQKNAIL